MEQANGFLGLGRTPRRAWFEVFQASLDAPTEPLGQNSEHFASDSSQPTRAILANRATGSFGTSGTTRPKQTP
jgi:hypothetical protein